MPPVNLSFDHNQTWDVARVNFEKGITRAEEKFGMWIRRIEWSEDKTSARLTGPMYDLHLQVDERHVHARGFLPFFPRMFEGPVRRFLEETFAKDDESG